MPPVDELIDFERAWGRAMVENDAGAIGGFMADDWVIAGSDGKVMDKATFLALVRSGTLVHHVMDFDEFQGRVYGDAAVATFRAVSKGTYAGHPFSEMERVSDVYVRKQGEWRCVLTHLSRIGGVPGVA